MKLTRNPLLTIMVKKLKLRCQNGVSRTHQDGELLFAVFQLLHSGMDAARRQDAGSVPSIVVQQLAAQQSGICGRLFQGQSCLFECV